MRILIVDDEAFFRVSFQSYIDWNAFGCEVVGLAKDGVEAIEAVQRLQPDLIFLDIQMPKMDGLQVLKKLKEMGSRAHVIMLSGFNQFEYVREAMRYGAVDYIHKVEMGPDSLAQIIRTQQEQGCVSTHTIASSNSNRDRDVQSCLQSMIHNLYFMSQSLDFKREHKYLRIGERNLFVISLTISNFSVVINRYAQKESLLYSGIDNLLKEMLRSESELEYLFYDKRIVCIIKSFQNRMSNQAMCKELDYLALKCINGLFRFLNLRVAVGISGCHNGYENLSKAADEALSASILEFTLQKNRGFHFEELKNYRIKEYLTVEDASAKLTQEIERGNKKKCAEIIKSLFSHDLSDVVFSSTAVKFAAKNIVYTLTKQNQKSIEFAREIDLSESIQGVLKVLFALIDYLIQTAAFDEKELYSKFVNQAIVYIQQHYSNSDISLQMIADNVSVNPSYLSRVFKKETNLNVTDYINRMRIQEAIVLLQKNEEAIYLIACKVGYNNVEYFNRMFKKYTEKSPSEYRGKYLQTQ
ncbi:response regulator [Oscillospiraceae bacterium PP1C4]